MSQRWSVKPEWMVLVMSGGLFGLYVLTDLVPRGAGGWWSGVVTAVTIGFVVVVVWLIVAGERGWRRARRWRRERRCMRCGYERRGIGRGVACPECGEVPRVW